MCKNKLVNIIIVLLLLFTYSAFSQVDTLRKTAVKIYIDCNNCDMSYIKENITFVNYVRDVKEAQVYILITSQYTGSGGDEVTIFFNGQKNLKDMSDTLKLNYSPDESNDGKRQKITAKIKLGLIRYILNTPIADMISVDYQSEGEAEEVVDKWKSWVFQTSLGGYINGEKSYKYNNYWENFSISKVTKENKFNLYLYRQEQNNTFIFTDTTYKTKTLNNSIYSTYVRAINDHWSYGGVGSFSTSTYRNYKYTTALKPAIEYNIFPYSESTVKQWRLFYSIGYIYSVYNDTTIYNKTEERLFKQNLSISYQVVQKWGSVSFTADASSYMHDFSKNNVGLWTTFNIRIFKGLSFNFNGSVNLVHDQIYLPKLDVSNEEILLRQRQQETQYEYWLNFGITYTFGSIYNNIVNPRFGN